MQRSACFLMALPFWFYLPFIEHGQLLLPGWKLGGRGRLLAVPYTGLSRSSSIFCATSMCATGSLP